mgnify:CR=1 FL=1
MRRSLLVFFAIVVILAPRGTAQTLGFSVSATNTLLLEPVVTINGIDVGESELSLRLAGGVSGPLELSLKVRETQSFGPLGNLTFYSEGAFRGGDFMVGLGAEGVIATVAGKATLSLSTIEAGKLEDTERYSATPESFFQSGSDKALKAELGLSASYRLNRSLILTAAPDIYYVNDAGAGVTFKTNVRFVRLIDRDDGYIYLNGHLSALDNDYAALGVAYDLNRRGLPNLQGSLWLGLNANGIRPGAGLELSQSFRDSGTRYRLNLHVEPFRTDILPYRARLILTQSLGENEVQLEAYGTLRNSFDTPLLTGKASYLWTF